MRYYETTTHSGLYRANDGLVFGVCKGIADYLDVSITGVRLLAVLSIVVTGFWPAVIAYGIAALVMKKDPYVTWHA